MKIIFQRPLIEVHKSNSVAKRIGILVDPSITYLLSNPGCGKKFKRIKESWEKFPQITLAKKCFIFMIVDGANFAELKLVVL